MGKCKAAGLTTSKSWAVTARMVLFWQWAGCTTITYGFHNFPQGCQTMAQFRDGIPLSSQNFEHIFCSIKANYFSMIINILPVQQITALHNNTPY